MSRVRSIAVLWILVCPLAAHAATVQLRPVADATLFAPSGDRASGSGAFLFIGSIASGEARRALLRFDLSGIPPGSTIQAASLRLVVNRAGVGSSPEDRALLYPLTAAWGEGPSESSGGGGDVATAGDVTWTDRVYLAQPPRPWAQAGGDYAGSPASVTMPGTGVHTLQDSPTLRQHIQAWVDNPASNHGWLLRDDEVRSQNAKRLFSREGGPDAPMLTIEYTPPAMSDNGDVPLPGWALALLGGALVSAVQRRRNGARKG
ncbi:DNRLRE domain-containing protein [Methyloversatilis thermotolerans]|uniref:DNRLRE domain-containing protein n=1 Tax=Methyloversatilis thermotolerans TaxID=1346290 RepID=UPI0003659746|nr:DNRLRE domain-containing protein [Methyloversatilis thermotolerans]